jgi:pyruvate kinase
VDKQKILILVVKKIKDGLLWGAKVFHYDATGKDLEATVKGMTDILKAKGLLAVGDTYVTTLSIPSNKNLKTNTVQLGTVE